MNVYRDARGLQIDPNRINDSLHRADKTEDEMREFLGEDADIDGFFVSLLESYAVQKQWYTASRK